MKGQLSNTVIAVVAGATMLFVGMWVLNIVMSSVTLPTTAYTVTREAIVFTTNNTDYATVGTSITGAQLYYFNNNTFPIPAARWAVGANSGSVKIYDNNTDGVPALYPNVTAGETYYLSYGWSRSNPQANSTLSTTQSITWNSITLLAVGLVVVVAVVILSFFGMGLRNRD